MEQLFHVFNSFDFKFSPVPQVSTFINCVYFDKKNRKRRHLIEELGPLKLVIQFFNYGVFILVPSRAPSGLEAYMVWETDIFLRWSSVPQGYENGIIRGFKIFLNLKNGAKTHVFVIREEGKRLEALSNLKPFSEYEVSILAYTLSGDGLTSSSITVTTDESGKLYM